MPIKYNLTKYDMLSTKIKKVSAKKSVMQMSKDEQGVMLKAVLIAAFSSGHSWRTYRTLTSQTADSFNKPEIKKEFGEALTSKWKLITPFDIVEVSTASISDGAFSEWLFFNVARGEHQEYKVAWKQLKSDFNQDCDTIEKTI